MPIYVSRQHSTAPHYCFISSRLRVFACPTFINKPENRAKMDHFLSNGPSFPLPPPSRSPTNQDKNRKNYLHHSGRNVRRTYRRFRGWTGFFLVCFAVLFFQWPAAPIIRIARGFALGSRTKQLAVLTFSEMGGNGSGRKSFGYRLSSIYCQRPHDRRHLRNGGHRLQRHLQRNRDH